MNLLYRVLLDGNDILSYDEPTRFLISPKVTIELNVSGSLEFTMPPEHAYYDKVQLMLSTLEVYEDNDLIWYGRPVEIRDDYWKQRQVYCEGALAFFNDTVQRYKIYDDVPISEFFVDVIS